MVQLKLKCLACIRAKVWVAQKHTAICNGPPTCDTPKLISRVQINDRQVQISLRVDSETLHLSAVHAIHLDSKCERIRARCQQTATKHTVQRSCPIYILVTQHLLLTFSAARRNWVRLLNSLLNINRLQGLKLHLATPYQVLFALFIRYTASGPLYWN